MSDDENITDVTSVLENITDVTSVLLDRSEWMARTSDMVETFSGLYSLLLLSITIVCNPLSFIVLSRKAFAKSNISVFLRCLTVSDAIAILLVGVKNSTKTLLGLDVLANGIMCDFYYYGINTTLYTSSWILVVVTFERVIAVVKPHSVQTICSRNNAKLSMAIVICVWMATMIFWPFVKQDYIYKFPNSTKVKVYPCILRVWTYLELDLITYFDNLFFAFLPSICLMASSLVIVIALRRSRKAMEAKEEKREDGEGGKSAKIITRASRDAAMTRTILSVNLCFVLCNFPYCIFNFLPSNYRVEDEWYWFLEGMIQNVLTLLLYTNNALNFAMYLATGTKFREELKAFFVEIGLFENPKLK